MVERYIVTIKMWVRVPFTTVKIIFKRSDSLMVECPAHNGYDAGSNPVRTKWKSILSLKGKTFIS